MAVRGVRGGFGARRFRFGGALPGGFGPGGGGVAPGAAGGVAGLFAPPGAPGGAGGLPGQGGGAFGGPGGGGGPGAGGAFGGDSSALRTAIAYARAHGGGTIGVDSQSSAAAAIIEQNADVAGLGGFSGRESTVSVAWLADEVAAGRLRWIIAGGSGGRRPGDTRQGSTTALDVAARVCRAVMLGGATTSSGAGPASSAGGASSTSGTLLDCAGRAAALKRAARP